MSESAKNMVMHMQLDILEGSHTLMGSDAPEEMGYILNKGNNVYIMLLPDTREHTEQLFNALREGATIEQELQDMFWGDYYGSLTDKYGVLWMFNCEKKA